MISTQFLDDNQRVILLKVATDMFGNILKKTLSTSTFCVTNSDCFVDTLFFSAEFRLILVYSFRP